MASAPDVLVSFVREALSRGIPREDIGRELERAGWSAREAALAMDAFATSTLAVPVPRKRVSSSPRDAFLHLLATALLYNSVVATGSVLFVLLDRWLPLPGERAFWQTGLLRWAAAALIVSLPILVLVRRTILRDQAANPIARMTPIYRFLAYFSLLVTVLVMAGDLVCLVIAFLGGDVGPRFLLKSLVVLLLAGGVYLWYSSDVGREEAPRAAGAPPPPAPAWRDRLWQGGLAAALVSLAAALVLLGNPLEARLRRLDEQRVADLRRIQSNVEQFHRRTGRLPATLDELGTDPDTFVEALADPVTGAAYGYEPSGDRSYRLSATFDRPSVDDGAPEWMRDGFFRHQAGRKAFEITVPERPAR